jgi:hypothetical protein
MKNTQKKLSLAIGSAILFVGIISFTNILERYFKLDHAKLIVPISNEAIRVEESFSRSCGGPTHEIFVLENIDGHNYKYIGIIEYQELKDTITLFDSITSNRINNEKLIRMVNEIYPLYLKLETVVDSSFEVSPLDSHRMSAPNVRIFAAHSRTQEYCAWSVIVLDEKGFKIHSTETDLSQLKIGNNYNVKSIGLGNCRDTIMNKDTVG